MPWVRAKVRDNDVYARADERGRLLSEGGRVEIRYQKNDGRLYRAAAGNVAVLDPTPLPDDTCGPAEEVRKDKPAKAAGAAAAGKGASAPAVTRIPSPPTVPDPGKALAYADGACSGNPGPAGLGVVLIHGRERIELSEYLGIATNNIAELTAVLRVLEALDPATPAQIFTDSRYAIGVITKGWKAKANRELVALLRETIEGRRVELHYVPGHAGVELNECADELARSAIVRRGNERTVRPI